MMKQIRKGAALVLLAIALGVGVQSFTSCELEGSSSSDSLLGYWKSSIYGDGFELYYESNQLKLKQYDDAEKNLSFAGNVVNNPDLTAGSGYLIIRITDGGSWVKTEGYYYAVHWKDFTGDTVKGAAAYKEGGKNEGVSTSKEAAAEYTVGNGYYAFYGEYERQ
jgi:hypothetical protein